MTTDTNRLRELAQRVKRLADIESKRGTTSGIMVQPDRLAMEWRCLDGDEFTLSMRESLAALPAILDELDAAKAEILSLLTELRGEAELRAKAEARLRLIDDHRDKIPSLQLNSGANDKRPMILFTDQQLLDIAQSVVAEAQAGWIRAEAERDAFRRSFDGHVYVTNERYGALAAVARAARELLDDAFYGTHEDCDEDDIDPPWKALIDALAKLKETT